MNFEFRTPSDARASAEIIDIAGRRVTQPLADQTLPSGIHRFRWDGLDAAGARVAPGVYMVRVQSGSAAAIQRIVLVR
jgi:flagellar hook assembly protein FlgD